MLPIMENDIEVKSNNISIHTVWKKIIFHHLNAYNSANMPDNHKIAFDYCLDTKVGVHICSVANGDLTWEN